MPLDSNKWKKVAGFITGHGKEEYRKKSMEKEKSAELVFILDRSASMAGLEEDTITGFNTMLRKQKEQKGEVKVTTVLFDDVIEELYFREKIEDVSQMADKQYFARGCTALLDAVGKTIQKIVLSGRAEKKKTDSVICVIVTDGFENASKKYTYESLKKLIEKQKKVGWEFLFLGANMDAVREAANFGISHDRSVVFHNDSLGIALNYQVIGETVAAMRIAEPEMVPIDGSWKEKIEEDYGKRNGGKYDV